MEYILIIFMSIGPLSDKDSMALGHIDGFYSVQECQTAGKAAVSKFATGTKQGDFVCVLRTKSK